MAFIAAGRARLTRHRPQPELPALALVALAPALLGIGRALPDHGFGLALRLGAAALLVLVVPGALVLRVLGWPRELGVAIAGALAWSLAAVFLALVVTFAAGGSLALTIVVLAVVCAVALAASGFAPRARCERSDAFAILALVLAGLLLGIAVWWIATTVTGDGLFHLARARKLDELGKLDSLGVVNEFRDGGLHSGYAFPLWHGVLALVSRFAAVNASLVVLHLGALLTPLALVLAYALGATLLRSWAGGVAAAAAQVGIVAFPRGGVGALELLALPATAARILLVPALLALAVAFVREGPRRLLLSVAACAGGLVVVHPSYAFFICIPLGGFLLARLALSGREGVGDATGIAAALAAVLVPSGVFLAWLYPIVSSTAGFRPDADQKARDLAHFSSQIDVVGESFRLAPDAIARAGPVAVGALLFVPLAVLAARRLSAAFVLGGAAAVLGVLLVPFLFTHLADLFSLSQARRLAGFLPLPLSVALTAWLAARFRLAGLGAALAVGSGLVLAYQGEFEYQVVRGGPGWVVWVAFVGGLVALGAGRVLRGLSRNGEGLSGQALRAPNREPAVSARWAAAVGLAFVVPVAINGLHGLERRKPDGYALSPGLVQALRAETRPGEVVFSQLETAYRVAAYVAVPIAASPPAHTADTKANRPYKRRADVVRFFFAKNVSPEDRARILERYRTRWLVVDKRRGYPQDFVAGLGAPVYQDRRYELYSIPPR